MFQGCFTGTGTSAHGASPKGVGQKKAHYAYFLHTVYLMMIKSISYSDMLLNYMGILCTYTMESAVIEASGT